MSAVHRRPSFTDMATGPAPPGSSNSTSTKIIAPPGGGGGGGRMQLEPLTGRPMSLKSMRLGTLKNTKPLFGREDQQRTTISDPTQLLSQDSTDDFADLQPLVSSSTQYLLQHLRPLDSAPNHSSLGSSLRACTAQLLPPPSAKKSRRYRRSTGVAEEEELPNLADAVASLDRIGKSTAKPQISFACLIAMAILDSDTKRLTVSEIYSWMKAKFPYFTTQHAGTGWKNSVRHNLSLNRHFVRQNREDEPGGKGSHWSIRPESLPQIEATIMKQHTRQQSSSSSSSKREEAVRPGPGATLSADDAACTLMSLVGKSSPLPAVARCQSGTTGRHAAKPCDAMEWTSLSTPLGIRTGRKPSDILLPVNMVGGPAKGHKRRNSGGDLRVLSSAKPLKPLKHKQPDVDLASPMAIPSGRLSKNATPEGPRGLASVPNVAPSFARRKLDVLLEGNKESTAEDELSASAALLSLAAACSDT